MRATLTEHQIKQAKPQAKPYFMWDDKIPGFGVKINPKGASVYVLQYRVGKNRRARRISLGRPAWMSLKEARHRAAASLLAVHNGEDPATATQQTFVPEAPTVRELWERFETEYAPTRIRNGRLTANTLDSYRYAASKYILPAIGRLSVTDVRRSDVEALVAPLAGRSQYNRLLAIVSRLFTLAEHWDLRPQGSNPARGIEKAREEARDRVLNPSELAALASAIDTSTHNPSAIAAIRIAALTGLRIGEILAIRWEHVDFESRRLTMPQTKTGRRVHDLPAPALAILASQPRIDDIAWVFGDRTSPLGYAATRRVFVKVCEAAGLENVRLHDLRRTVMTNAAMAGIGTHVLRDLLGHKTTAMADRYVRAVGNPVRDAREQVGAAIAAMMEGKSGEVVSLGQS